MKQTMRDWSMAACGGTAASAALDHWALALFSLMVTLMFFYGAYKNGEFNDDNKEG